MALLKRLSDSFLSYVSPRKTQTKQQTHTIVPRLQRPAISERRGSIEDLIRRNGSMSRIAGIDDRRIASPAGAVDLVTNGGKRKRSSTPSSRGWRRRTLCKMEDHSIDYTPGLEFDDDTSMDDVRDNDEDDDDELASILSNIRVAESPPLREAYDEESLDVDDTVVVSEEEYNRLTPQRKRVVSLPAEHESRGVSTNELRAAGWGDSHITLVQRLAMRGYEPLLPQHWKFDYRFMPDALFEANDDAFISSVRSDHYRGVKALERLFELGGWVRDRVLLNGRVKPEEQVRRQLREYMKWAEADANLDPRTAIPLLALEMQPANSPAAQLQENARRKLARLAERYHESFLIRRSVEGSGSSSSMSVELTYPIPQLYAIVASHTVIGLVAYAPHDQERQVKPVAFFDMKDKDYDVWNALALAIIVCHLRNVQIDIAKETGLGLKQPGEAKVIAEDDPDA